MNCYKCENQSEYTCTCISPSVFTCNDHIKYPMTEAGNHAVQISKCTDLFPMLFKDLKRINLQIKENCYLKSQNY